MKNVSFAILIFSFTTTFAQPARENENLNVEQKTFVYKIVNNIPIELDFFQVEGNTTLKPVIVWIHGGALMAGSRKNLPEVQKKFYLEAGYSIASIDYRLAPETKLPNIIEDLRDAVQWVQRNGAKKLHVDSTRIFVIGHSAGGYLALMTGYVLPTPPRAIVSFYGYGDIRGDWYSKPDSFYLTHPRVPEERARQLIGDSTITSSSFETRGDIYLYSRQNGKWPLMVGGHDPEKEASWFYQYCPLKNIRRNYPPVLLLHGDKDTDVPYEQSVLMDKELSAKKIKHKLFTMKDGQHGFDYEFDKETVKMAFKAVADFLKENE